MEESRSGEQEGEGLSTASYLRLVSASTLSLLLGFGYRSYRQVRNNRGEASNKQLVSGVGFAAKALGIATVISVSAFGLVIVAVSALIGVNSPRQFGQKMTALAGDRFRLKGSERSETWEDVVRRFV